MNDASEKELERMADKLAKQDVTNVPYIKIVDALILAFYMGYDESTKNRETRDRLTAKVIK